MNNISKINVNGTTYGIVDTVTTINSKSGAITASDIATVLSAAGYKLTDDNTVTSINGKTGAIDAADIASVLTTAGYKLTDSDTTYAAGTGVTISGTNNAINVTYGNTAGTACQGNDSRLSDSRPASDVYSWAKQPSKPSYNLDEVSDGSTRKLADKIGKTINTTWANLKSLRDNSQLVTGQFYRITDYECTTTQKNTQSAGHQFDIIVRADAANVLNENAYAALHSGDTYFASSKLEAWRLQYSIDNDTNRFGWADTTNGKGVIYFMRDEHSNECPYDFKNIQFKPGAKEQAGTVADVFYYTFSVATGTNDTTITDHSLQGAFCYGNKMGKYIKNYKHYLNANVFHDISSAGSCRSNTFGNDCHSNTFGNNCFYNTFGDNCYSNTFGNYCNYNTFGDNCYSNTFGNYCNYNTFGDNCYSNTFGNYCLSNTFGNSCYYNTFGNNCFYNTFGNSCYSNTFGNNCFYNTFGDNCYSNTFGNYFRTSKFGNYCTSNTFGDECSYNKFGNGCTSNTFGDECSSNTFGTGCSYNKFGNGCYSNTFGNSCHYNTFGDDENIKSYCRFIIVENGNKRLNINCSATTSLSKFFQNIKISQGVNNSDVITVSITHPTAGDVFQTEYKPKNSVTISVAAHGEYGESSRNVISDII